jgi:hypothetical protein
MTAKEKVLQHLPSWSEEQAERALLAAETELKDPVLALIDNAPEDDEPLNAEDEAALAEVAADRAAGVPTIAFEEIKRKYGHG